MEIMLMNCFAHIDANDSKVHRIWAKSSVDIDNYHDVFISFKFF